MTGTHSDPQEPVHRRPLLPTVTEPSGAAGLGTVLGVWAHPDDEAYLSAGLMALARQAGHHVTCLTATLGEHGTDDPGRWPPERLARTRRLEIAACMAVLGVDDHRLLGYEDGALAEQPPGPAIAAIAAVIDEIRPDTIVTFGPDGMTGHPDHKTVSAWTTAAWERTGRRGRLLYATTTAAFADEFADIHGMIPVFGPGLPMRTPAGRLSLAIELDGDLLDRKLAALRAQATQVQPLVEQIGEDRYRRWWRTETFRAAPQYSAGRAQGDVRETGPHHRAGDLPGRARRRRRARRRLAPPAGGRAREAARPRPEPARPS